MSKVLTHDGATAGEGVETTMMYLFSVAWNPMFTTPVRFIHTKSGLAEAIKGVQVAFAPFPPA